MIVGCPSCGAPVEFKAGASVVVVCQNCKFAVYRTDRDLRLVGKVADLAQTDSPLSLGLHGTFRGVPFTIVGRIQLDHGQGPWDEWYCAFQDGRWGWLAEAQGRFYLTFGVPPPQVYLESLAPGVRAYLDGAEFAVGEVGNGRYVAAEGELPTAFQPGGWFRYADLTSAGGGFATLDFGQAAGGPPQHAYIGYVVPFQDLGIPIDPNAKRLAAMAAGGPPGEGGALRCPNCGGNLEVRAPGATRRIACPYCNSLLDASSGPLRWLEVLQQQQTVPKIPIGSKGRLDLLLKESTVTGKAPPQWTVIGYMTRGCQVEGTWYFWDEYLLYEPTLGFRFLLEQNGHWSVISPIEAGAVQVGAVFDSYATWRGIAFQKFSAVQAVVTRVLGEFYWAVQIGELAFATDYIHPNKGLMISREDSQDGERREVNWSLGHYVDGKDLYKAFGLTTTPPVPYGVAPNQPSEAKKSAKVMGLMALALFAAWVVALMSISGSAREKEVFDETITLPLPKPEPIEGADPADGPPEAAYYSEPFEIPVGTNAEAVIITTGLQNSYLWVGGALIHEKTGTVHEFEVEPSSYSGVEDGESWSEGSLTQTATVSGLSPGTYVLRLQPVYDVSGNCARPGQCPAQFSVKLKNDTPLYWPGVLALLFILAVPVISLIRIGAFESRRWSDSNLRSSSSSWSDDD